MTIAIRPFREEDYEAFGPAFNAAYADADGVPMVPDWPEEMRQNDKERQEHIRFLRLVAEEDGELVGVTEYDQAAHRYDPRKYIFDLFVRPDKQRQGIGTALYNALLESLLPHDPLSLRISVREDLPHGIQFLEHRGWTEQMRIWESFLDVASANVDPFLGAEEKLSASGIIIETYPEAKAADPDLDRKLYDLAWEIRQDLPDLDAATQESFETWSTKRLNDPHQIWNAFFIAFDGDQPIAFLYHFGKDEDPGWMKIAQLGVARAYRKRGIARALKEREILYALAHNYHTIRTTNESNNRGILKLNEQMGFAKKPAWVDMVKVFTQK